jgi:cytochrome c553
MRACLACAPALGAVICLLLGVQAFAQDSPGRQKVTQACAVCHGVDGIGKNPDVPNLAGESTIYLEKQLKAFKSGERKHEQMSIIAQGLQDKDIVDLAAWYASIKISVQVPQ